MKIPAPENPAPVGTAVPPPLPEAVPLPMAPPEPGSELPPGKPPLLPPATPLPTVADPLPTIPEAAAPGEKIVPYEPGLAPMGVDGPGEAPIDRPLTSPKQPPLPTPVSDSVGLFQTTMDAPTGFSGKSSVIPRDFQTDPRFVPVEDRWRIGFPEYDRYGRGHPWVDDYLYLPGHWWDPYNQNVLKGDYPIAGQNIFLNLTATSRTITGPLQTPVATTPFESTSRPYQEQFFGSPNIGAMQQYFILSFDLFRGDTAVFRPIDWRLKVMPIFNVNYITVDELAVVNPDVRRGRQRGRSFLALEEWFFEFKIADLGPNYDFVSVRAGAQEFNSDFRGLIFFDINKGVRLFGTRNSNREQFNLVYFDMLEKDTNSFLNTFRDRGQNVLIGNYYVQDFIWPGYTAQWSFHYNRDGPSFHFDRNDTLVRPDPIGIFRPHGLDVFYLGWAGDGHINRFNINHAFYWALGRDSNNPIANRGVDINGQFAALELSYDRDYMRFRTSYLYSSGDRNPFNGTATGFDAILENPQFAGGEFSYWQRQAVRLFGINITNIGSIVPAMKSSKIQGQSNFVNPGLHLVNFGVDIDITPRFRMINNVNLLWFDSPQVLRAYVYSPQIETEIGTDLSMGFEYRPFLNNNVIWKFGAAGLLPGRGFRDLFNNLRSTVDPLVAAFVDLELTY